MLTIIIVSLLAGVAGTGIGGLAGAFLRAEDRHIGRLMAFAGGAMAGAACFELIPESIELSAGFFAHSGAVIGLLAAVAGCAIIFGVNKLIDYVMCKAGGVDLHMHGHSSSEGLFHSHADLPAADDMQNAEAHEHEVHGNTDEANLNEGSHCCGEHAGHSVSAYARDSACVGEDTGLPIEGGEQAATHALNESAHVRESADGEQAVAVGGIIGQDTLCDGKASGEEFSGCDCGCEAIGGEVRRGRGKTFAATHAGGQGNAAALKGAGFLMLLAIMLHNFPEGAAIGSAGALNEGLGAVLAIVVALHNIPAGFAISAPLVAGGTKRISAILLTALAGAATAAGAMFGLFLGGLSALFSGVLLGLSGGAMLYATFGEIMQQSIRLNGGKMPAAWMFAGLMLSAAAVFFL
ncbi:MAG: ZIP family metal transporter [Clostridiaceae bacterium]|jgi:zinc transporter ZupT|nr:ZIP family metal transporter [Clostridiaceae bacterium]